MVEGLSAGDLEKLDRDALVSLVMELMDTVEQLRASNERLTAEVERLRAEAGRNSGNSSKPSLRDTAAERRRQAEERRSRGEGTAVEPRPRRNKGAQRGAPGFGPKMAAEPTVVVDHVPDRCSGCGRGSWTVPGSCRGGGR